MKRMPFRPMSADEVDAGRHEYERRRFVYKSIDFAAWARKLNTDTLILMQDSRPLSTPLLTESEYPPKTHSYLGATYL